MKRILNTLAQKWPEYLIEAIVIIASIIGAYALDSWNEERQKEEKLLAILEKVKDDLLYDLSRLDRLIQNNERSYLEADSILNRTYSWKKKPESFLHPRGYDLRFWLLTFSKDSYTELIKVSETIPEKYYPLLNLLNRVFNVYTTSVDNSYDEMTHISHTYDQLMMNLDWYDRMVSGDSIDARAQEYFENNSAFRTTYRSYSGTLLSLNWDHHKVIGHNTYLIREISSITQKPLNLDKFLPSGSPSFSEKELSEYRGTYVRDDTNDTVRFTIEGEHILGRRKLDTYDVNYYYLPHGIDTISAYPRSHTIVFQRDSTNSFSKLTMFFLSIPLEYRKVDLN